MYYIKHSSVALIIMMMFVVSCLSKHPSSRGYGGTLACGLNADRIHNRILYVYVNVLSDVV